MEKKVLEDLLYQLLTKNIDLKGRRVINAGTAIDAGDYVTKAEYDTLLKRVESLEKK